MCKIDKPYKCSKGLLGNVHACLIDTSILPTTIMLVATVLYWPVVWCVYCEISDTQLVHCGIGAYNRWPLRVSHTFVRPFIHVSLSTPVYRRRSNGTCTHQSRIGLKSTRIFAKRRFLLFMLNEMLKIALKLIVAR